MQYWRGLLAAIGLSKDLSCGSGPGRKEPGCAALSFLSFYYMAVVKGSCTRLDYGYRNGSDCWSDLVDSAAGRDGLIADRVATITHGHRLIAKRHIHARTPHRHSIHPLGPNFYMSPSGSWPRHHTSSKWSLADGSRVRCRFD
jgi:hypothetical protein